MINEMTDRMKKLLLAGVGAVANTAEKSQEIVKDLIEKGELTVEQGKALNEELKNNLKAKTPDEKADAIINSLSEEEIEALKGKLS